MSGFFEDYFEINTVKKEVAVCCPFPHKDALGHDYFETNPSAHVNTEKRVFNCKVCGQGLSESKFISEVYNCTLENAAKLLNICRKAEHRMDWETGTELDANGEHLLTQLGISKEVRSLFL